MSAGAAAVMYFLFAIVANGPIAMTQLGNFKSKAECSAARDAVQGAIGKSTTQFVCVSSTSLDDLEKANR